MTTEIQELTVEQIEKEIESKLDRQYVDCPQCGCGNFSSVKTGDDAEIRCTRCGIDSDKATELDYGSKEGHSSGRLEVWNTGSLIVQARGGWALNDRTYIDEQPQLELPDRIYEYVDERLMELAKEVGRRDSE